MKISETALELGPIITIIMKYIWLTVTSCSVDYVVLNLVLLFILLTQSRFFSNSQTSQITIYYYLGRS